MAEGVSTAPYSQTAGITMPYRTTGTTTYRQSATQGQTNSALAIQPSAIPIGVSTQR